MLYDEMIRQRFCPLCNSPDAEVMSHPNRSRTALVRCSRCGTFQITEEAAEVLPKERHLLSAVCRTWQGTDPPLIKTDTISTLLAKVPRYGVAERLNLLLKHVADGTKQFGDWSSFDPQNDYPLLAMKSAAEVYFLIQEMESRGYLLAKQQATSRLTVKGWERLEETMRMGRESSFAFVAMWFHESVQALYEQAIEPAVRDAGYEPIRIDKHPHLNRIDDEIIGQLRRSRFMVADFTGQRGGVYFEAGFMRGLGRNVIWMCNKDELGKVHFDVRQYNFIDWSTADEARTRLLHSIRANEGEGPLLPAGGRGSDV